MKRVVNAVVRIEYEADENCYWSDIPDEEKESVAISLAINPNFVTEECGIKLTSVHLNKTTPYAVVDWYDLKHNPEQVFVKP